MILNYDVDELFKFEAVADGYSLSEYLRKYDPSITEIEIPEEYNGKPVLRLGRRSFANADELKSVTLPKGLEKINDNAFENCEKLENVVFKSAPKFGTDVFLDCKRLPADVTLMGLLRSRDLSAPFGKKFFAENFRSENHSMLYVLFENPYNREAILSPKVLELALKNDCFRKVDIFVMLKFIIDDWKSESIRVAWEHGLFDGRALLDEHIELSAQKGTTELTAYLLELKRRRFGFNGSDDFEL